MTPADLLRLLVDLLERLGVPYAIGGSVASIADGEPRATLDIDVVVDLVAEHVADLAEGFGPEFHFDTVAALDAVSRRRPFNVIHPASGLKIDLFVVGDAIERSQIDRRRRLPALPGLTATFSPPEELILKKLQYYERGGSDKHLRDIAAMLAVSGDQIDVDMISRRAAEFGLSGPWFAILRVEDDNPT